MYLMKLWNKLEHLLTLGKKIYCRQCLKNFLKLFGFQRRSVDPMTAIFRQSAGLVYINLLVSVLVFLTVETDTSCRVF